MVLSCRVSEGDDVIHRRSLALLLAVVAGAASWSGAPLPVRAEGSGPAGRPNVLVILTDDQRADSMFMMPKTRKWFAEGGTTFPEAYANTPLCCPVRSSLMSGRYQHNHGVKDNHSGKMLDQEATLQKYLHDAGYQTGLDGKFLIGWPMGKAPPSFDHFAHFLGGYTNVEWNVDGARQTPPGYVTDFQSDRAVDFIDDFARDAGRPWYLYLTPQAPHSDFTPAPEYANAPVPDWQMSPAVTQTDRSDKPDFIRQQRYSWVKAKAAREGQLRTLLSVDDMVDRVFRHLQDTGQLDNTLAIYTSDSGWLYSEHGLHSKAVPYTDSVAVPFFVRWPGHVADGATDGRPVGLLDIAPSVLEATGTAPALKYPMDGRSFLSAGGRPESLLEYHYSPDFPDVPSWASIRTAAFQYIEWYEDAEGRTLKVAEYYDLAADPYQLDNRLGDKDPGNDPNPAQLAELAGRLARYRHCQGQAGPLACP
jgi:arylsulfatase A-like enzyme